MFDGKTALYLKQITFREDKEEDGTSRKVMVLGFQLEPFTADHAAALNVKSRLFGSDGTPHPNVLRGTLAIHADGDQRVTFFRAPDDEMPQSLVLRNVRVGEALTYRQDSETPNFSARLSLITDGIPDPKGLQYLIEGHCCQHHLTFEPEQGDLLADEEDTAARKPALRNPKGKGKGKGQERELRPGVKGEFDDKGQIAPGVVQ